MTCKMLAKEPGVWQGLPWPVISYGGLCMVPTERYMVLSVLLPKEPPVPDMQLVKKDVIK